MTQAMDHDCRLYLVTPPTLPPGFPTHLAAALAAGDVAAVRLDLAGDALRQAAETLRPIVQSRGAALILADEAALAAAAHADGVHLGRDAALPTAQARKLIGELQLGVFCGASRDAAMLAGEAGADYVAFDSHAEGALELIAWWSELMELPVVAEGAITPENCPALVRAGANFLAAGDAVWKHPEGPAAGVRALAAAMAAA
jgi:thiamine-phosphate pyrophosphorylase